MKKLKNKLRNSLTPFGLDNETNRAAWVKKVLADIAPGSLTQRFLTRLDADDRGSSELLCFGYPVLARKSGEAPS